MWHRQPLAHLSALSLTWLLCTALLMLQVVQGRGLVTLFYIRPALTLSEKAMLLLESITALTTASKVLQQTPLMGNSTAALAGDSPPLVKEKHPLTDASGTLLLHTMMLQSQKRKYRMTLKDFDLVGSFHDILGHKVDPEDLSFLEP